MTKDAERAQRSFIIQQAQEEDEKRKLGLVRSMADREEARMAQRKALPELDGRVSAMLEAHGLRRSEFIDWLQAVL